MSAESVDVSAFYLDPEEDLGNNEYKYQLIGLTRDELESKITQLNFRLDEGCGEAIYNLGVTDNGCPLGITQDKLDETLENLTQMAEQLDARIQVINMTESPISIYQKYNRELYAKCFRVTPSSLTKEDLEAKRYVAEVMVRRNHQDHNYMGLRIGVAGSADSGKTTCMGVLTRGVNDDGNGKARRSVFNYKHEIDSGQTSSVAQEIIGFNSNGEIVNELLMKKKFDGSKAPSWAEIAKVSSKICTFYDFAGQEKYFPTTIRGLSAGADYCLIMVGANMGITPMTREHMIVCLMTGIPMIVVITKIDLAPEHIKNENINTITKLLTGAGVNKTPYMIKDKRDVTNCCHNISSGLIVPILQISNVTGQNLDLLKTLLNCLPPRHNYHEQLKKPAKYTIQEIFYVQGIGTVVSGFLMSGVVSVKSTMWLGPDSSGTFKRVVIKSIHDKRTDVVNAFAGQSVCFALRNVDRNHVHRGMVMIDGKESEPSGILEFEAQIEIIGKTYTSVRIGYEPIIHISNIKQTAKIMKIFNVTRRTQPTNQKASSEDKKIPENDLDGNPVLRAGDKAHVIFRLRFFPAYFEPGTKILFREGRTRGVGIVEKLIDLKDSLMTTISSSTRKKYKMLDKRQPENKTIQPSIIT